MVTDGNKKISFILSMNLNLFVFNTPSCGLSRKPQSVRCSAAPTAEGSRTVGRVGRARPASVPTAATGSGGTAPGASWRLLFCRGGAATAAFAAAVRRAVAN